MSDEAIDNAIEVTNLGGVSSDFSTEFIVGSGDGEYPTIQAALDACTTGYIVIKPGLYTGATTIFPTRRFTWHIKMYGAVISQTLHIIDSSVNLYGGTIVRTDDLGMYATNSTVYLYDVDFTLGANAMGLIVITSTVYITKSLVNYTDYAFTVLTAGGLYFTDVIMVSSPGANTPLIINNANTYLVFDRCDFDDVCNLVGGPAVSGSVDVRATNSVLRGTYSIISSITAENCVIGSINVDVDGFSQIMFLQGCRVLNDYIVRNFVRVTLLDCAFDYATLSTNTELVMKGCTIVFSHEIYGSNINMSNCVLYGGSSLTFLGDNNMISSTLIENANMETNGIVHIVGCTFVIFSGINYINGYTGLFEITECTMLADFAITMSSANISNTLWANTNTQQVVVQNNAVSVNLNMCSFVNRSGFASLIISPNGAIPTTQTSVTKCSFTTTNDLESITLINDAPSVACDLYVYESTVVNSGTAAAIHNYDDNVTFPAVAHHANNLTNSVAGYVGDPGTSSETTILTF